MTHHDLGCTYVGGEAQEVSVRIKQWMPADPDCVWVDTEQFGSHKLVREIKTTILNPYTVVDAHIFDILQRAVTMWYETQWFPSKYHGGWWMPSCCDKRLPDAKNSQTILEISSRSWRQSFSFEPKWHKCVIFSSKPLASFTSLFTLRCDYFAPPIQ